MKERIEVNGVWYVREEEVLPTSLYVTEFEGMVFENNHYCVEVTRVVHDGEPAADVLMEYTSKEVPTITEYWDNTDWMLGMYQGSPLSLKQLYLIMDESRIKQIQSIVGTLIEKGWIELRPQDL